MAEGNQGNEAGPGADASAAADGDGIESVDWTCRMMGVERIMADPTQDDDDLEDIFEVRFQVDGPNANAEVEIVVSDFEDEADVVGIALDTLHRAMKAWGRVTENRRIAARDTIA